MENKYENEIITDVISVKVKVVTNKGERDIIFTDMKTPIINNVDTIGNALITGNNVGDKYKAIVFDSANIIIGHLK